MQEHVDENGWVNLVIAKRREVSEKGATHYAYKSEYQKQNSQPQQQMAPTPSQQQPTPNPIEDDDLPF